MTEIQTTKKPNNAYAVTNNKPKSKWGSAIQSLAAEFRNLKACAAPGAALETCRNRFYRIFWELSCTKSKAVLWCRGFSAQANQDAEDAASVATTNLIKQEKDNTGVFGLGAVDDVELCAYLSATVCQGARQRVREIVTGHKRACGLWTETVDKAEKKSDPAQDDLRLQQLCMDVRDVSMAIAPKYKGRLPAVGTTPVGEVLIDVCLDRLEHDLAKRTYQRLRSDIREDLRTALSV
jgi:hypothetical protein